MDVPTATNKVHLDHCHQQISFIFYQGLSAQLRHNVWILAIGNNKPLTASQVLNDITALQVPNNFIKVTFVLSKQDGSCPPTDIEHHWTAFETMAPIIHKCSPVATPDNPVLSPSKLSPSTHDSLPATPTQDSPMRPTRSSRLSRPSRPLHQPILLNFLLLSVLFYNNSLKLLFFHLLSLPKLWRL